MNTCPWCNTPSSNTHIRLKDYFLSQEEFEIKECPSCGLLFTVPRPAPEHMGKYYQSNNYFSHQENQTGFIPRIYEWVKSFNLKNKVKMATFGLPPGRVLDIGCGVGDFLLQMKQSGWEVQGIEPSNEAKAIAQKRLGFTPLAPSDYSLLDDASFDLITLWHVFEHVDDLKSQTSEIMRLLKPNGRLVIAVPNYQSFDCQYYKDKWAAWDVPRHLNHFTTHTLCSILSSVGFTVLWANHLRWDAYYISYLSEQYLHHSLPLIRGAFRGLVSNLKARSSNNWSSMVYFFEKEGL